MWSTFWDDLLVGGLAWLQDLGVLGDEWGEVGWGEGRGLGTESPSGEAACLPFHGASLRLDQAPQEAEVWPVPCALKMGMFVESLELSAEPLLCVQRLPFAVVAAAATASRSSWERRFSA